MTTDEPAVAHEGDTEVHAEHDIPMQALVVLITSLSLLIGGLLRMVNKKYKIPYTPQLLILGMFFSYYQSDVPHLSDGIQLFLHIEPHAVLAVFIPVLIFDPGFMTSFFLFKQIFW